MAQCRSRSGESLRLRRCDARAFSMRLNGVWAIRPIQDHIVFDPEICHGKPVIPGTRTPVAGILSVLSAGGDGFETPQGEFNITAEGIRVCIGFAAKEIDEISNWPVMV